VVASLMQHLRGTSYFITSVMGLELVELVETKDKIMEEDTEGGTVAKAETEAVRAHRRRWRTRISAPRVTATAPAPHFS